MSNPLSEVFDSLIAPLKRRVMLMVGRAILRKVVDTEKCQTIDLQAETGETLRHVEHPHPYGFTTHPKPEAEIVLLSVGGNRADAIAVMVEDQRHRPTGLAQGEVALHDDQQQIVKLARAGIVARVPVGNTITLECGRSSIVIADGGVTITTPAFDLVKS